MVVYCFMCGRNSEKDWNLSFFRFPKNEKRCLTWLRTALNLTGRPHLPKYTPAFCYKNLRVCSRHFDEEMFAGMSRSRLKLNAIPVLFCKSTIELRSRPVSCEESDSLQEQPLQPIIIDEIRQPSTSTFSFTSIKVEDIKLENDISESQFHSELQEELPVQEQQSDIFSNLCRSCAKQNEDLIPFDVIPSAGISIFAVFNEIGLTISGDDEFPKKICKTCLGELLLIHRFYKKIQNSKSVFERLLLEKNYTEPVNVKKDNDVFKQEEDESDDDDDFELMQIDEEDPLFICSVPKKCSICGTNQLQDDQMLDHKLSQHVPVSNQEDCNIMTCPYCKTEFSIMLWYDDHLEKCHGQMKLNCIVCKLIVSQKYFDSHLKERHMLEKIDSNLFRCIASENCTYFSSSVLMLNEHQMAKHDKSLYVCHICGSDYIASQKLIAHHRTHEKEASML